MNIIDAIKYIGGHWEDNGKRQFDFLIGEGLMPHHKMLDIGCGCARGGRFFIKYLNSGNYYGLEQHEWLINAGKQVLIELIVEKRPIFIINDSFDVQYKDFDYIFAKSVFTHLTKDKIRECMLKMQNNINKDGAFYASFFIGDSINNPIKSDDTRKFMYSEEEIIEMTPGWSIKNLGSSGCYRQTMIKFKLK